MKVNGQEIVERIKGGGEKYFPSKPSKTEYELGYPNL